MRFKNDINYSICSLGISYFFYSFLQYIFGPICWWLSRNWGLFDWMNSLFDIFTESGLNVFSLKSLLYSALGLFTFFIGFFSVSINFGKFSKGFVVKKWNFRRAEIIFWALFVSGFLYKSIKILAGVDVNNIVSTNIKHSFFSDPYTTFYLSFNWFNLVALILINVIYQEAKYINHYATFKFRSLAYGYTIFFLLCSFGTGSRAASLFPILGLIITKLAYSKKPLPLSKAIVFIAFSMSVIFCIKLFLAKILDIEGANDTTEPGLYFAFFYVIFFRVNLSYVVEAVIQNGQQAFPNGTFSQFWVDMSLHLFSSDNPFDGNIFGRALGLAGQDDFSTGVASTNMGDWFINFDFLGIIFGMFITGFLYKIVFNNCRQPYPFFVMLYALMWPILIHGMESPVSVLYSTSIKMILLCVIVQLAITIKTSNKFR